MKSKLTIFLILLITVIFPNKISYSKEILINSQEINIYDNGNVVVATNGSAVSEEDFIQIFAERIEYKKRKIIKSEQFISNFR